VNDISPILLVGIGFFLGTVCSIFVLDMVYKRQMKRALDEIGKQYSIALDIIKNCPKKDDQV
jgi:hypothetical protein